MKYLPILLLAAALATGCQETPSVSGDPVQMLPASVSKAAGGMQFARNVAPMEERQTAARAAIQAMLAVASQADDWREADAATQRALESAESDLAREAIEQSTAKMMLTGFLVKAHDDPEAARAALRYTRRLVDLQSPEAEVVLAAVEAFKDEWSVAETEAVVEGAISALDAYVAEGGSCADCERSDDAQRTLARAGMEPDVYVARQRNAAERLRAAVE